VRFQEQFEALRAEIPAAIREIRIRGAMIGLDLTFDAGEIVTECLHRKLLVNVTHTHVVRLLPALTITDDQIDEGCAILAEVLRNAAVSQ
jgi:acetylornithine/succinyldiaminopimelate/putrescine aminotransferase